MKKNIIPIHEGERISFSSLALIKGGSTPATCQSNGCTINYGSCKTNNCNINELSCDVNSCDGNYKVCEKDCRSNMVICRGNLNSGTCPQAV